MTILMALYLLPDGHPTPIPWDEEPTGERLYYDCDGCMTTEVTPDRLYRPYDGYDEARPSRGRRVFVHTRKRGRIEVVAVHERDDVPVAEGHVMYPALQDGEFLMPLEASP